MALPSLVLSALASSASLAAPPDDAVGHWAGDLTFREAALPVRLHVADADAVTLDIPDLIMAWEPVPTEPTADGLSVTLPFGLGPLDVAFDGDGASGRADVGGSTLSLELSRTSPPPFTREPLVVTTDDDVTLVGEFVVPDGEGPHPAVVMLHGSSNHGLDSWAYRSWADLLAREGCAVALYDKRGVGSSGGELGADLQRLVDDAHAVVDAAAARADVDAARLGIKGGSQGAWLAEQVAVDRGDVAFLLLTSAPSSTPRDQDLQQLEYGLRDDGVAEADIEEALIHAGLYFHVAATGDGWDVLQRATERAADEPWIDYVDQPRTLDDLSWWRDNHAFRPPVEQLELPALLLYGADDWIVPPIENAAELAARFGDPEQVDVHVFPRADHRLEVPARTDADGRWHWPRIAPGVRETVTEWLARR